MKFIWVGKTRDSRVRELESDYLARVLHYYFCEVSIAKPSHDGSNSDRLTREAIEIRTRLKPGCYTIALDSHGTRMDSIAFSRFLGSLADTAVKDVTFIIGGHLGIEAPLLKSINRILSLSQMTFPHELCRVLLLEQVYRACSLINGTPYHK